MNHFAGNSKSLVRSVALLAAWTALTLCLTAQSSKLCDVEAAFARVSGLLASGHDGEARAGLKQLQSCQDLSPAVSFKIGLLYEKSQAPAAALAIFESLPADVPDRATHRYAIALTEFDLGNFANTVETLKAAQNEGVLDSKCANLLGVAYSKLGSYEQAYTVLADNLERYPSDLPSYLNIVTVFSDAGRFGQAADVATQAVTAFPGNADVLVARGSIYTQLGQLDKAKSDFEAAIELSPRQPKPRLLLALSQYKLNDFAGASASLQAAIRLGAVDSDVYYLHSECLLKVDPANSHEAIVELDHAIALDGKSVKARTLRGKLLLDSGQFKAAFNDLSLAHQLDPGLRSAAYNLARAESKLGMTEEAKTLFQQLGTANGEAPEVPDGTNPKNAP